MNALTELQKWYVSNCNGHWEHDYGITIGTLDNPGWLIKIDLVGTNLEGCPFPSVKIENSGADWYVCDVVANHFEGYGDSNKLELLIIIFLTWAKSEK